ncbi:MAG: bifunctional nuclease domain-containing protein [Lepagella sp.]
MSKIRLELLGITYNQIESGVYAVVLQEMGGTRRIPIIIGFPEAQAIECKLQNIVVPRPLTHDLAINMLSAYGIQVVEANIYKLPNGVFAAELVLSDGNEVKVVDSRSSDAIALAIRVGAPIFTTPEVMAEAGFEPGEQVPSRVIGKMSRSSSKSKPANNNNNENKEKSIEQLKKEMQQASEAERYEEAARIKAEIERRLKAGTTE